MNFIREDLNCVPLIIRFHLASRFLKCRQEQKIRWPIQLTPANTIQLLEEILADRQNDDQV